MSSSTLDLAEAAALLHALAASGVVVDARTQLVVTCELCRRPATKSCWVCSAAICEFCTRRQHAKVRACVLLLHACMFLFVERRSHVCPDACPTVACLHDSFCILVCCMQVA